MVVEAPLDRVAVESVSEEMSWDDIPMIRKNQAQGDLQTNNPGRRNGRSKGSEVRTSPMASRGGSSAWVTEMGECQEMRIEGYEGVRLYNALDAIEKVQISF